METGLFETRFITEAVERKPFQDRFAKNFFIQWCDLNGSIYPEFVTRKLWERMKGTTILKRNFEGGYTIFIPEDLALWEVVNIVRAIDYKTFSDQKKEMGVNKI